MLYEDEDIGVKLLAGDGMDEFLADAKEKVQKSGYKKSGHGPGIQSDPGYDFEELGYCSLYGMYGLHNLGGRYENFKSVKKL